MRESIGGAMMLRIILIVIVLFFIFLCISANLAKALRVKNKVINIIEQYQGVNPISVKEIENYVKEVGYSCKTGSSTNTYSNITKYILKDEVPPIRGEFTSGDGYIWRYGSDPSEYSTTKNRIYNIRVCVKWSIPLVNAGGVWEINGRTDLIKDAVYS